MTSVESRTFLRRSLWCLAIFAVLVVLERRFKFRKGQTMALYIALYTAGRFVFENMRSDFAHTIGGLRINAWMSLALCLGGIGWFAWLARHGVAYEPGPQIRPTTYPRHPDRSRPIPPGE